MSQISQSFNQSGFGRFINSPAGRTFRVIAGVGFIILGFAFREHTLGIVSIVWGFLPLTAGAFDVCYVSAALGGPLSGAKIRATTASR